MFEIDGQVFREGDIVRFERAPFQSNRVRDYEIAAVVADDLIVTATADRWEFTFRFGRDEAARIGIRHADHRTA
ncbi:hypothetical protein [Streptomyces bauhiniae]|uniref:Uncharacterized protein n=1 Tax=Streptomyces bauhiniae TaxID=2340725 RepID=A0A7K3QRG0_9ACTN|nr:hypothetical protein [Streptomyces bauhiniae]NEB92415.1 hypothetical protein [Streptomyces bauhiniae]